MGKLLKIGLLFLMANLFFLHPSSSAVSIKNFDRISQFELSKKETKQQKRFSKIQKRKKGKKKRNPIFSNLALGILIVTVFGGLFFNGIVGLLLIGFIIFAILGFLQTLIRKGKYKTDLAKKLFLVVVIVIACFIALVLFLYCLLKSKPG